MDSQDSDSSVWGLSNEAITKTMAEMGINLTQHQKEAISEILLGNDLVVKMPTGSGKSMIFQALLYCHVKKGGDNVVIVITPLNSISFTHMKIFEKLGISCLNAQDQLTGKNFHALVTSPECIAYDQPKAKQIVEAVGHRCALVVIDEAHCVTTWGTKQCNENTAFRKSFRELTNFVTLLKTRPTILCMSATLDDILEKSTIDILGLSSCVKTINLNPINPRISFINRDGELNVDFITSLLERKYCPRMLIFRTSIVKCGLLYLELKKALETRNQGSSENVRKVEIFHSATPQWKQEEIAKDLLSSDGSIKIVIATSALSMGFDASGVEYVIHDTMPVHLHDFVQMSGRTGRKNGLRAYAILLSDNNNRGIRSSSSSNQYKTQNKECRRLALSRYFQGDVVGWSNDANDVCCDVCGTSRDEVVSNITILTQEMGVKPAESPTRKRTVTRQHKFLLKKALLELRSSQNDREFPFLNVQLTDGIIEYLVTNACKIGSKSDIDALVPGLSRDLLEELMGIVKEFFVDLQNDQEGPVC